MKKFVTLTVIAVSAAGACAQAVCTQLEDAITSAEKVMSYELVSGQLDNSAPRESTRQARIANAWASVQTSLTLMQMNRCPPYTRVISERAFFGAALKCTLAVSRPGGLAAGEVPSECKRDTWTRAGDATSK